MVRNGRDVVYNCLHVMSEFAWNCDKVSKVWMDVTITLFNDHVNVEILQEDTRSGNRWLD